MTRIATVTSYLTAVCLIFVLMTMAHPAGAEGKTGLSITPTVIESGGDPGSRQQFSFRIKNVSEQYLPIRITAQPFSGESQEQDEYFREFSAHSWLAIQDPEFIIKPGELREIRASVAIPSESEAGSHFVRLLVRALVLENTATALTVLPEVSVDAFVVVSGELSYEHQVLSQPNMFNFAGRSEDNTLRYTIKNNGNVHTLLRPGLAITSFRKADSEVIASPQILLPKQEKEIEFTLSQSDVSTGLHSIKLAYDFGVPTQSVESSASWLIILPFQPRFLFGVILISLGFVSFRYRNRLRLAGRALLKGASAHK
jgi:hypothetical protein